MRLQKVTMQYPPSPSNQNISLPFFLTPRKMTYLQPGYKITSTGIWMQYQHKSLNIATRQLPPVGGNSSALAAIPDLDKAMNGTFSMLMVNHIPYHIWAGHTYQ